MPTRVGHGASDARRVPASSGSDGFFLVIVSGLEAGTGPVSLLIIPQPLHQLTCRPSSSVMITGIRGAHSRVYQLDEER
jgi:hypothetical protein